MAGEPFGWTWAGQPVLKNLDILNGATVQAADPIEIVGSFTIGGNAPQAVLQGSLVINQQGRLVVPRSGFLALTGNLLGDTQNADQYSANGNILLNGSGDSGNPQLLEAMSGDLGATSDGYLDNFAYRTLQLANNTYVRLVDQSDNAAGTEPEAVYTGSLVVPAGTTLDLNGLRLYARTIQIAGTVVNGMISQVPDSGPLTLNTPTSGAISVASEIDEWTFYGLAGRSVTVLVDPGSSTAAGPVSPKLGWVEVLLLDAAGAVVASAANSGTGSGTTVTLDGVALPSSGNYGHGLGRGRHGVHADQDQHHDRHGRHPGGRRVHVGHGRGACRLRRDRIRRQQRPVCLDDAAHGHVYRRLAAGWHVFAQRFQLGRHGPGARFRDDRRRGRQGESGHQPDRAQFHRLPRRLHHLRDVRQHGQRRDGRAAAGAQRHA